MGDGVTVESEVADLRREVKDVSDSLRLLRDANRIQGRRLSATAPTDKQVVMWNADTKKWEPVTGAQILFARATGNLTLTTSYQSITGDGDSSKLRLTLPTIGDWLVEVTCDLGQTGATAPGNLSGALFVDDSGSEETGDAVKTPQANGDRDTVAQRWKITTTSADTPIELKAKMTTGGGNAACRTEHTTLVASIGIGGGSAAAASDHGNLTGRGDTADHDWALLVDGTRALTDDWDAGTFKVQSDKLQADTAMILGSETTAGIRLDTFAGVFRVREGDNSAAAPMRTSSMTTDVILEETPDTGVTIDGVLIKDGQIVGLTKQETYIPFGNEPEAGVTIFPT